MSSMRRNMMNVVRNYSDAKIKVCLTLKNNSIKYLGNYLHQSIEILTNLILSKINSY